MSAEAATRTKLFTRRASSVGSENPDYGAKITATAARVEPFRKENHNSPDNSYHYAVVSPSTSVVAD